MDTMVKLVQKLRQEMTECENTKHKAINVQRQGEYMLERKTWRDRWWVEGDEREL